MKAKKLLTSDMLVPFGISNDLAFSICNHTHRLFDDNSPTQSWSFLSRHILQKNIPFPVHQFIFNYLFTSQNEDYPAAVWAPDEDFINATHISILMKQCGYKNYSDFHKFSCENPEGFWKLVIDILGISFKTAPEKILDLSNGVEQPCWLPGARFNITDSMHPKNLNHVAIRYQLTGQSTQSVSYKELHQLSNRVAGGLVKHNIVPGTTIGIVMPMNPNSIAVYLGIIKAGCTAVMIPESFSAQEISTRLQMTQTKFVFAQDHLLRKDKKLPLYDKVFAALDEDSTVVVVPENPKALHKCQIGDIAWEDFISESTEFEAIAVDADHPLSILFSSGTTGDPKAIPWNHTTPIKAASDAYLHFDLKNEDVFALPTSLGWMMGPWLIFATLINHATMALFEGSPNETEYGFFIEKSEVTVLGLVPSLVKTWRNSGCMIDLDWSKIKAFLSTGESSNPADMMYLMMLAGYKPVIEYCGGTEIGGAYLTSTLIHPSIPSAFSTPALGSNFVIIDETGVELSSGEAAIIPPSIGLSTKLLNKDHHAAYYAKMPTWEGKVLRRHGDQLIKLKNGYYRALGRVDDTMNLSGIKVSSVEIERCLNSCPQINECAAIAIPPKEGGPSLLVIVAVVKKEMDKDLLLRILQTKIKTDYNPLFKIHDVVIVSTLPRTPSNKIMRRILRTKYQHGAL